MTTPQKTGIERRRGVRINADFWLTLAKIFDQPKLLKGDISISGLFIHIEKSLGKIGSILPVTITTTDKKHTLKVMTRVVRIVRYDDILQSEVIAGVGLEFLTTSQEQRFSIEQFVRTVAQIQAMKSKNLQLSYQFKAAVDRQDQTQKLATIETISLDGMLLHTDWPVQIGESIKVEIQAPASKKVVHLTGKAIHSEKEPFSDGSQRYVTDVHFDQEQIKSEIIDTTNEKNIISTVGSSIIDALDTLMTESNAPQVAEDQISSATHLQGTLAQIKLTSLLAFLELERRSGAIIITRECQVTLYLKQGNIVDLTCSQPITSIKAALQDLLTWESGEFEVNFFPVERKDQLSLSTTELLLNLARETDEANR